MKTRHHLIAAFLVIIVTGGIAWATESLSNLDSQTTAAAKDETTATADAKANVPKGDAKTKEDDLDKAARKNEDTPDKAKDKPNTEKGEKDAETAADTAAKGDPDKAKAYRAALKKRREARAKLKNICAQLASILQARRRIATDTSDIDPILKKCREALRDSENVVATAARVVPGNPNLPGQVYVAKPGDFRDDGPVPCTSTELACADSTRKLPGTDDYRGPRATPNKAPPIVPGVPDVTRGEVPGYPLPSPQDVPGGTRVPGRF